MMESIRAPFFEIGPKNFLRRAQIESLALVAGQAGSEFNVNVVLTVPTALVATVAELANGVLVFAQGLDPGRMGESMNIVTAESLVDAGAAGVMLNHDSNPLDDDNLIVAIARANELGLLTIVCAATELEAIRFAQLQPSVVLFEPPALIGTTGHDEREWVGPVSSAIHQAQPGVLAMHAGGVSSPEVAKRIMAAGADGTGATSGVIFADEMAEAARSFIAATRSGWDIAAQS